MSQKWQNFYPLFSCVSQPFASLKVQYPQLFSISSTLNIPCQKVWNFRLVMTELYTQALLIWCHVIFHVCHSRLIHTGQFLNDLAAPVAMGAPPLVSSTWFPPNQRATATAISSLTSYVGISISFGVGPFVLNPSEVADPPTVNVTAPDSVAAGSNSTMNSWVWLSYQFDDWIL